MSEVDGVPTSGIGGLNPYSNGRYSMSLIVFSLMANRTGLNPYSNGRYSMSVLSKPSLSYRKVLILILMEDTL